MAISRARKGLRSNRTQNKLADTAAGLYILGNADDLSSKSSMWRKMIQDLDAKGCVGSAFPTKCHQHPDTAINYISAPGQLPRLAPDGERSSHCTKIQELTVIAGGCLNRCDKRLNCGHLCPYKVSSLPSNDAGPSIFRQCHADDPYHLAMSCNESCSRLCSRGHPCHLSCSQPCGDCAFPIENVTLPCGHTKAAIPW